MFRNYIKLALRNLRRSITFSLINIFGLAIGLTCCMLLLIYVNSELSFDKHHKAADNIYLVSSTAILNGEKEEWARLSSLYAAALKMEFPQIEQTSRLWDNIIENKTLIRVEEPGKPMRALYETMGMHVDSTFFSMFDYEFVEGDSKTAITGPNDLVLTETVAEKYFGKEKVLGKTVRISGVTGNDQPFKITGVVKDESGRSHINGRFFVSMNAGWVGRFLKDQPQNFSSNNMFYTYIQLKPGTDPAVVRTNLKRFMDKHARKEITTAGYDKFLNLIPLEKIHLYPGLKTIVSANNSMTYLYIIISIAAFILLIACINFMNLSTARSVKRAAEVGIRKVMGAGKTGLVKQFLGESVFLAVIALLVSFTILLAVLPGFNALTGKNFSFRDFTSLQMLGTAFLLAIVTGFIAGSYPAFYLSVFNPIKVLKGKFQNSISATALRKGLVVFQFVISIGLVLAAIVIQAQMNFLRNQPLGFDADQQIVVPLRGNATSHAYPALRDAFLKNSSIKGAEGTLYYPGILNPSDYSLYRADQTVNDIQSVLTNWVSPGYLKMMGFQPVAGRVFSTDFMADTTNALVVNEAMIRKFGIDAGKAVGQRFNFDWQGQTHTFEIVGVVKDFHFEALHQPIQPFAFLLNNVNRFNHIIVHINQANAKQVLTFMESEWRKIRPDEPFEYSYLKEDFQKNYDADRKTASIVNYFTAISILISCLGLFGLAAFAAQQRTKEIGVRKVLGASTANINALLTKDFIVLVIIAIVIACPLSWYFMNQWLHEFAYQTKIEWWIFALTAIIALTIAMITVSFQSVKAAWMNPVKSLRAE